VTPDNEQSDASGAPATGGRRLLLASASPRRRELLGLLGVRFVVVASRFDEATLASLAASDAPEYVRRAASGKAEEVAGRRAGLILGVDTDVVAPDGQVLGKPRNPDEAHAMLRSLSGRTHTVFSGVTLLESDGQHAVLRRDDRLVETRVTLGDLSDTAIRAYVASGEPFDKAGGYGMQGRAMPFVTRIEGDPSNVIGLPLWTVAEMLAGFGLPLWSQWPDTAGNNPDAAALPSPP
jgi:septum formation protein